MSVLVVEKGRTRIWRSLQKNQLNKFKLDLDLDNMLNTCIITCFPSIAPKQLGICHLSLNPLAILYQWLVSHKGKTSSFNNNQIASQHSLTICDTVVMPTRKAYEMDVILSPVAKYLK